MLERLKQLGTNVAELVRFKTKTSLEELQNDLQKQWILRYGLFECIQSIIDISCHLVVRYNGGRKTCNFNAETRSSFVDFCDF